MDNLKIRTGLTERSIAEHERAIRFLRDQFGDNRMIHKITPLDVRRFLGWYRHRKTKGQVVATATANKLLRECRRIFREAVDCQLIRSNPFAGIRQERVSQPVWHHVSPDEYHRLLEAAPSLRWKGIIALAYCCGLRLGEILNLTWADVDFEAGMVRVIRKQGCREATDWEPKDKDARAVPIPKPVVDLLTSAQMSAKDRQVYVFVLERGPNIGKRLKRANIWRDFNVIRCRAGVPVCCVHDLRRSYCTNLARAIPMHVVQELAGHSDIRTTRRYYIKVEPELLDAARRAVEASLEGDALRDTGILRVGHLVCASPI